jgi:hypothetical protein
MPSAAPADGRWNQTGSNHLSWHTLERGDFSSNRHRLAWSERNGAVCRDGPIVFQTVISEKTLGPATAAQNRRPPRKSSRTTNNRMMAPIAE